jgi:two-component sensor histidine kinase
MAALIQSVVSLTSRDAISVDAYKQVLQGRLGAISESLDLMQAGESGTTLLELLRHELEPFRNAHGTNIVFEGPAIALNPKAGVSIGLVIHEFATNAVKYGALSVSAVSSR